MEYGFLGFFVFSSVHHLREFSIGFCINCDKYRLTPLFSSQSWKEFVSWQSYHMPIILNTTRLPYIAVADLIGNMHHFTLFMRRSCDDDMMVNLLS